MITLAVGLMVSSIETDWVLPTLATIVNCGPSNARCQWVRPECVQMSWSQMMWANRQLTDPGFPAGPLTSKRVDDVGEVRGTTDHRHVPGIEIDDLCLSEAPDHLVLNLEANAGIT